MAGAGLVAALVLSAPAAVAEGKPPNIIIIMTDDIGYSDLGCFGSEIETPHLDSLAARGLRFSQFYNTGKCCPTRAALLTGLYSHQAGVGNMLKDEGLPGYRGRLNERCVTIGEVLGPAGYRTIQTGKWHVGADKKECTAPVGQTSPMCRFASSRAMFTKAELQRRSSLTGPPASAPNCTVRSFTNPLMSST